MVLQKRHSHAVGRRCTTTTQLDLAPLRSQKQDIPELDLGRGAQNEGKEMVPGRERALLGRVRNGRWGADVMSSFFCSQQLVGQVENSSCGLRAPAGEPAEQPGGRRSSISTTEEEEDAAASDVTQMAKPRTLNVLGGLTDFLGHHLKKRSDPRKT